MKRTIIQIDRERCNGCGQCVQACHEGAIALVDGKAQLVSEVYCDGLGACIGHCPVDAITTVEREAEAFDAHKVAEHLHAQAHQQGRAHDHHHQHPPVPQGQIRLESPACSCPGAAMRPVVPKAAACQATQPGQTPSQLAQWPVQLRLVPPNAPFLKNADLLICADCVPFALGDFHQRYLQGRVLVVACPKLDPPEANQARLEALMQHGGMRSVTVLRMEVPCCGGLAHLAQQARNRFAPQLPFAIHVIGIEGGVRIEA